MINDKIFFDEKDPTGLSYNTPFTVYGSFNGRLWSKTPEGTVKFYVQGEDIVNDLTTGGVAVPASAETVKDLKTQLDAKGKVLQVVQASTETLVSISTTTPTDTGLTASITPKKTNSKIEVITFHPFRLFQNSVQDVRCRIDLLRASTVILSETPQIDVVSTSGARLISDSSVFSIVDEPTIANPPEAITYKTQAFQLIGSPTIEMNRLAGGIEGAKSIMILREIEPNT